MTNRTAILTCLYLTIITIALYALAILTAQYINAARLLYDYSPPVQHIEIIEHKDTDRLDEIDERVRELEDFVSRAETFTATAYTHAVPGGDINGTGDGITASGLRVREGLVAVDPKIIPLGSLVWVEGFGILLAADVGGAIKGNRIDIFMDDKAAALRFKKRLRVVVL